MQEARDFKEERNMPDCSVTGQHTGILKGITWILAYAVWIFIFLIPFIGIVLIITFLLRNKPALKEMKAIPQEK